MTVYGYGDSLMWGWDPRIGAGDNRLREDEIWFERLSSVYGFTVINDSLPGRKIPGKRPLKQFLSAVSGREWQVLFLMLGTNDILDNTSLPFTKIGRKWDVALSALVDMYPDRKDRIVLSTCPYAPIFGLTDTLARLRKGYREAAELAGVRFFDALDPLPTLYDAIHLSEEGHRMLAERVADYLRNTFGKE